MRRDQVRPTRFHRKPHSCEREICPKAVCMHDIDGRIPKLFAKTWGKPKALLAEYWKYSCCPRGPGRKILVRMLVRKPKDTDVDCLILSQGLRHSSDAGEHAAASPAYEWRQARHAQAGFRLFAAF